MSGIAGIKFDNSSKVYGFMAGDMELQKGDRVVVESELGMSLGRVVSTDFGVDDPNREVKPILRKASEKDLEKLRENEEHRVEAHRFCLERIMARGLPMKLILTDVTLDRKRFIFYFVADTRIDFRELVKDLASKFRTRIELRQIGIRDAAMMTGGIGVCGREFCCRVFLKGFAPISIKMAKKQELVLNTSKLSGACGRLMCCLNYEYDDYPRRKKQKEPAPAETERPGDEIRESRKEEAQAETGKKPGVRTPEPEKPDATAQAGETPDASAQAGEKTEASDKKPRRQRRKRWRRRRKKK